MRVATETRLLIRHKYKRCCAYCGVSEDDVGGELEIEHYQPVAHGGSDDLENLLYVCTTCNRFKGSYWPTAGTASTFHLLRPDKDDLTEHVTELATGELIGLTERGQFHIRWLHLNRTQLVKWRFLRLQNQTLNQLLAETQQTNRNLRTRIAELETEIQRLRSQIQHFTNR